MTDIHSFRDGVSPVLFFKHLKDVVSRVESAGIETLGVGINTDAVKKFYSKWVTYHDMDTMITGVYETISKLLRTGTLGDRAA